MNCDVIQDLLPLYIDGCCSESSARVVEEHLGVCPHCKKGLENAVMPLLQTEVIVPPKLNRISQWRGSVLQSVLLFVYFGLVTVGVALEAQTPSGVMNGFWGFGLVVPATGFLLSLTNWYFVRLHSSRAAFIRGSILSTAAMTLVCFLIGLTHYEVPLSEPALILRGMSGYGLPGTIFFGINLLLSGLLSGRYASLVGKEGR